MESFFQDPRSGIRKVFLRSDIWDPGSEKFFQDPRSGIRKVFSRSEIRDPGSERNVVWSDSDFEFFNQINMYKSFQIFYWELYKYFWDFQTITIIQKIVQINILLWTHNKDLLLEMTECKTTTEQNTGNNQKTSFAHRLVLMILGAAIL